LPGSASAAEWKLAAPGWRYEFPRDHSIHEEFKTEWWYFTGNLADASGRRFGYQLTFFRQGIRHPAERDSAMSRFVVGDLKFSHFTVTDVAGRQFRFDQKTSRGAFGEAGFEDGERLAWNQSWTLRRDAEDVFHLAADMPGAAIKLRVRATKPPVIHGTDGISRKAAGEGHASHYYSLTRMESAGEVTVDGRTFQVTGRAGSTASGRRLSSPRSRSAGIGFRCNSRTAPS
jgi:predicted secreted hydrolase